MQVLIELLYNTLWSLQLNVPLPCSKLLIQPFMINALCMWPGVVLLKYDLGTMARSSRGNESFDRQDEFMFP